MRVKSTIFRTSVLRKLSRCLKEAYVVGGYVRDALLGFKKGEIDVDVVVNGNANLETLQKELGVRPFVFRKEKTVFTFYSKGKFRVDLTFLKSSLYEDLKDRDFTINAMAVPLGGIFSSPDVKIVDPFKGLKDLKSKLIKPVSPFSLEKDSLRLLRGIRFKLMFGFRYHSSFVEQAEKVSDSVSNLPCERIRDELFKILPHPLFHLYLKELDSFKVLFEIFKELKGIEKIPPSGCHQYDLKTHTLLTVKYLELVAFETFLKERVKKTEELALLKLVALYHDVAKPLTVNKKNGRLTFYNHDKIGAEIAKNAFKRLALGEKASKMAFLVIKNHLRPFFLYDLYKKGKLTKKAVFRLFASSFPYHYHLLLHSVADFCATSPLFRKKLSSFLNFLKELDSLFCEFETLKPLLTGWEIMEIKKFEKPSPCVGKIKEKLLELQAEGKITSKEEAIKFVKGFSCG